MSSNYTRKPFIIFDYNDTNKIAKEMLLDSNTEKLYVRDHNNINEFEIGMSYVIQNTKDMIDKIRDGVKDSRDTFRKIKMDIDHLTEWLLVKNDTEDIDCITDIIDLFSNVERTPTIKSLLESKVDKEDGKVLSSNNLDKNMEFKLSTIEFGANNYIHPKEISCGYKNAVNSVNGKTENVILSKSDFGLDNVEAGANLYIHPDDKVCKAESVISVNGYKYEVELTKTDIGLPNVENIKLSTEYDRDKDYYTIPYLVRAEVDSVLSSKPILNPLTSVKNKLTIITNMDNNTIRLNNGDNINIPGKNNTISLYPEDYGFIVVNNDARKTYPYIGSIDMSCGDRTINIYIETEYTLTITSNVTDFAVDLEEIDTGYTYKGSVNTLREGVYVYKVSKEHFDTVSGTIDLRSDQNIHVIMEKTKYILDIRTTPSNAYSQVMISGRYVSGKYFDYLTNGNYKIITTAPYHYDDDRTVNIVSNTVEYINLKEYEISNIRISTDANDATCVIINRGTRKTVSLPHNFDSYRFEEYTFILSAPNYQTKTFHYTHNTRTGESLYYRLDALIRIKVETSFPHLVSAYIMKNGTTDRINISVSNSSPYISHLVPEGRYTLYYNGTSQGQVSGAIAGRTYNLFLRVQGKATIQVNTNPTDLHVKLYRNGWYSEAKSNSGIKTFQVDYSGEYYLKAECPNGVDTSTESDRFKITSALITKHLTSVCKTTATLNIVLGSEVISSDIRLYINGVYYTGTITQTHNGWSVPIDTSQREVIAQVRYNTRCPGEYLSNEFTESRTFNKFSTRPASILVMNNCYAPPSRPTLTVKTTSDVDIEVSGAGISRFDDSSRTTRQFTVKSYEDYSVMARCKRGSGYDYGSVYISTSDETISLYPRCSSAPDPRPDPEPSRPSTVTLRVNTSPESATAHINPTDTNSTDRPQSRSGSNPKVFTVNYNERYDYWAQCSDGTKGSILSVRRRYDGEVDASVNCGSPGGWYTLTIRSNDGRHFAGCILYNLTSTMHDEIRTYGSSYTFRCYAGNRYQAIIYLDGLGDAGSAGGDKRTFTMPNRDYTIYLNAY